MKLFIAVAFAALIASALANPVELNEEQKAKAKLYGEECMKQEDISEEEALKLRNKDFTNPSDKLKCFANCFFEKAGTIKDGAVQEDVVLEKLGGLIGEEKTREVMAKCNSVKGENNCDTAFKLYECYEVAKAEILA